MSSAFNHVFQLIIFVKTSVTVKYLKTYLESTKLDSITFSQRLNVQFFPEGRPVFENPANHLTWHASCNPFMNSTKQKQKPKTKKGHKRIIQKFVFPLLSSKTRERFILRAPVCILKSHRTRRVIHNVVQVEFVGCCSTKKAPARKQWVQAGGKAVGAYSRQAVLAV